MKTNDSLVLHLKPDYMRALLSGAGYVSPPGAIIVQPAKMEQRQGTQVGGDYIIQVKIEKILKVDTTPKLVEQKEIIYPNENEAI